MWEHCWDMQTKVTFFLTMPSSKCFFFVNYYRLKKFNQIIKKYMVKEI